MAVGSVLVVEHWSWLKRTANDSRLTWDINNDNLLLIPQLVLLAGSLATLLFTASFDWLYPLRVLLVGSVMYFYRARLQLHTLRIDKLSVFVGSLVFVFWMLLVLSSGELNQQFSAVLFSVPPAVSLGWIVARCIGAIIIVPLAEELAFRGYLLPLIEKTCATRFGAQASRAIALLGSSIAFGAMHGNWLAASIAGVAYGLIKLRRNNLMDAVVAHATTNMLLAAYVLYFRQWSLW